MTGTIHALTRFEALTEVVTPQTLVLLDIDQTVLRWPTLVSDTLLNAHYIRAKVARWHAQGQESAQIGRALERLVMALERIEPDLVDAATPGLVRGWQEAGVEVMAVTARPAGPGVWARLRPRLFERLARHGVDLTRTAPPSAAALALDEEGRVRYERGVFFTSFLDKGAQTLALLERLAHPPRPRVVFVDDHRLNCERVAAAFATVGVRCDCYHYAVAAGAGEQVDVAAADEALEAFLAREGEALAREGEALAREDEADE